MAGTNVSFATRIDDIGANMADRLPNIITHEYIWVILSFGASSTNRQSQDTVVIFIVPFSSAATTKTKSPD